MRKKSNLFQSVHIRGNTVFLTLFFLIFIIAILLRGQETFSRNFLFLIDQGRDMLAVKDIIYSHHVTLIGPYTSLQGVFQGPGWYYLLAIPTFLLRGDPWGGVILMLLISLGTLLLAFLGMKRFFGSAASLVTLFLFAVSPQSIAAATYVWNPHPMWLLLVLFIFSFYLVTLGKNKFNILLWLTVGCMFHFETALAILILLSSLLYFIIVKRSLFISKYFFYGFCFFLVTFLPQVLFDVRHNFLMTRAFLAVLHGDEKGLLVGKKISFFQNANDHLQTFLTNFQGAFLHEKQLSFLPMVIIFLTVGALIFFAYKKKITKNEYLFLRVCSVMVILIFLITLSYPYPLRYWFFTGFEVFFLLPIALLLSKLWYGIIGKTILSTLIIIMVFCALQKIQTLYTHPDYGGVAKVKGKLDVINYIYHDANGKSFSLFTFTPPVYTYAYDYLIWWKGKNTYNFIPTHEKQGIFYLLIEPDPSKMWSYKGWEETVIRTGNILKTKELSSGFIVQKRFIK